MHERAVSNGRFRFDLEYRDFGGDEGLAIRVLGPVGDEERELLRYDCFEKGPHYHVGVHAANEITKIAADDPVAWSLTDLATRFEALIEAAGADAPTDDESAALQGTLAVLGNVAHELVRDA